VKTLSPDETKQIADGAMFFNCMTQRLIVVNLVLIAPPLPMAGDYTRLL